MVAEQQMALIDEIDTCLVNGDNLTALRVLARALALYLPAEKFDKLAGFVKMMGWVSWDANVASKTEIFTDEERANVFGTSLLPLALKRRCLRIMAYRKDGLIAYHETQISKSVTEGNYLSAIKHYAAMLIVADDEGCDFSTLLQLVERLAVVAWNDKTAADLSVLDVGEYERFLRGETVSDALKHAFLRVIDFGLHSSREWNSCFFEKYYKPVMQLLIRDGRYNLVRRLAIETQLGFGWQPHTEAQAAYCYAAYSHDLAAAARNERLKFPVRQAEPGHFPTPKVAIFMDFGLNNSSPIGLLLDILTPIALAEKPAFVPVIYAFSGADPITVRLFGEVGIEVVDVGRLRGVPLVDDDFLALLCFIQEKIHRDGVRAVIYCHSSDFFWTFCAAFRMAPLQILWTMTHHFANLPEIDAYLSSGGAWYASSRKIGAHSWHTLPVCMNADSASRHLQQGRSVAEQMRSRDFQSGTVIIGSIARPEKIDSDAYFDMVAGVIHACPDAIFVWFGNSALASVCEKIKIRHIEDRCFFRGWVDPTVYAQVLDIHLDTVPYQNGISMRLSMAAGTAMVLFDGGDAAGNLASEILPAYTGQFGPEAQQAMREVFTDEQGRTLLYCAADVDEYIAHVKLLVEDASLRAAVGHAALKFAARYTFNQKSVADLLTQHVHELISQN